MFKTKSLLAGSFLALLLLSSGCSGKQFGREFENALGSLGRKEIQTLGAPGKGMSLVQRSLTGEFAVLSPKKSMHLGSEFTEVRAVKEFSDGSADYVVLACIREDGSIKNVILTIPADPSSAKIFLLDSTSSKPFSVDASKRPTRLMQAEDSPQSQRTWYLDSPSDIRGPVFASASATTAPKNKKQKTQQSTQEDGEQTERRSRPVIVLPPIVNPDDSIRLEERRDDPAPERDAQQETKAVAEPSAPPAPSEPVTQKKKPVIVLTPVQKSPPAAQEGADKQGKI